MQEVKIISADITDEQLKGLYETAFPNDEKIPWGHLMRLIDEMQLDFTACYEGTTLIGFTIVYPHKPFNWFWYFAVPAPLRGKGVGQQILSRLTERYKDSSNILDMESPLQQDCDNLEQRRRRYHFYLRNGFRDTGVGRSFDGIDYTIMMMGDGTFTMQDYDNIIAELRSFWDSMPSPED